MCYEPGARPPFPPITGGAADAEKTTLTASDGNTFAAVAAHASGDGRPGIVILPDVRGLHPFYEDLALRFAEAGVHAVAIDYFGRTAGVTSRDDDFEFWPHVQETRPATVTLDATAGVAHMRERGVARIYTVGFCFGGRHSFNMAGRGLGLAGVIGFYGRVAPRDDEDPDAPIDQAGSYACPVLGLFGGADMGIPVDDVETFRKTLDAAGVGNEIVVYEGAPHSFFDRAQDAFTKECDDGWRRILAFVGAAS